MNNTIDLFNLLTQFKEGTIGLIKSLENEDYFSLESQLDERQEIINRIDELTYSKNEFEKICRELQIMDLTSKLNGLMLAKRTKIKVEIANFAKQKTANNSYRKSGNVDSLFFNKKI